MQSMIWMRSWCQMQVSLMLCEVKMVKLPWKIFGAKVDPLLISMEEWNNNNDISINLSKWCHKHHILHVWYTDAEICRFSFFHLMWNTLYMDQSGARIRVSWIYAIRQTVYGIENLDNLITSFHWKTNLTTNSKF